MGPPRRRTGAGVHRRQRASERRPVVLLWTASMTPATEKRLLAMVAALSATVEAQTAELQSLRHEIRAAFPSRPVAGSDLALLGALARIGGTFTSAEVCRLARAGDKELRDALDAALI